MATWSELLARPARAPDVTRPSLTLFFLLTGVFLLTLVPHVIQFPFWISACIVVAMLIRMVLEAYRLPLPSTTFTGIVAVILLGLIFVQFGTLRGRDSGTAFTAGLLAIKFYELRKPRDVALIIFSCFFVVMSALLYSQVLELFIYCMIMMWVLIALLLRVQMGDTANDRLLVTLRISGFVFLQGIPLTLMLFFFFPRYHGTIGLPLDESPLGLTDNVAPGSIAKLAQNDDEAMYVHFPARDAPPAEGMYWRALVLWDYKNGAWTPGSAAFLATRTDELTPAEANGIRQEITILPHNQRWLFALDTPVAPPINLAEPRTWASLINGNVIQLNYGKLDHKTRYDVISSPFRLEEILTPTKRDAALALPDSPEDHIDPQVVALAKKLHEGLRDDQSEDYLYAVLRFFRHGGFVYSITPGAEGAGEAWLPNFLFEKKTGFCEHFASSFGVLMRLGHVPTRMVVGYFGAEYNPYTDSYTVSQSNAHAWDEVWMPTKGAAESNRGRWIRIDPTALLTAAEPSMGSRNNNKPGDSGTISVAQHTPGFFESNMPDWAKNGMKEFKLRREQVESHWDNVVLSYNSQMQNKLAQKLGLGMGENARIGLLGIFLVTAAVCLIIIQKWVARKPKLPPVEKLYASFCRIMARRGIPRALWEGPLAYTERVGEVFPDDKGTIQRVGAIVAHARYGPVPAEQGQLDNLKELLDRLSASQAASREKKEPAST